jgi:CDP-diacylglycerol--glycerol-3-phosphate 3-phosphatidyltransferase
MFVIVGLMYCDFAGAATLAFLLFLAAALGDWLDGYLARTRQQVSNFGKLMDAMADKIMVLGIVIALVERHEVWMVLALITLCREFLVTAMRMVAASKGVVVAADTGGKSKTVTQLIAIGCFLGAAVVARDLPRFVRWDVSPLVHGVVQTGLWIFVFATVLSVWSGCRYVSRNSQVVFGDEKARA